MILSITKLRLIGTQNNDYHHNNIKHNDIQHNNDKMGQSALMALMLKPSGIMLRVTIKPIMLSVIMLYDVIQNVFASLELFCKTFLL